MKKARHHLTGPEILSTRSLTFDQTERERESSQTKIVSKICLTGQAAITESIQSGKQEHSKIFSNF